MTLDEMVALFHEFDLSVDSMPKGTERYTPSSSIRSYPAHLILDYHSTVVTSDAFWARLLPDQTPPTHGPDFSVMVQAWFATQGIDGTPRAVWSHQRNPEGRITSGVSRFLSFHFDPAAGSHHALARFTRAMQDLGVTIVDRAYLAADPTRRTVQNWRASHKAPGI